MFPTIPTYVTAITITAAFSIAGAVWSVLSRAASRAGLEPAARRRVQIGSAAFVGGWLGTLLLLARAPSSLADGNPYSITPLIPLFGVLSLTTAFVAWQRSRSLRRVLAFVPLSALHALQVWRVVGILFVLLYSLGQLPAHFALPAGWGDVAVGATAPPVALAVLRRRRGALRVAVLWNLVGLADLVAAVGMGTGLVAPLLAPGLGPQVPPAAAMGVLPMILVPAFAVPVSTIVHVLALVRLRRELGPEASAEREGHLRWKGETP